MSALTFLGLARKAGNAPSGDDQVNIAARAGKVKLILTASDAGRSTQVRAENAARAAKCPAVPLPFTKAELGAALGCGSAGVAALTDTGFAYAFLEKLHGETGGHEEALAALAALDARAAQRRREQRRHRQKLKRGQK